MSLFRAVSAYLSPLFAVLFFAAALTAGAAIVSPAPAEADTIRVVVAQGRWWRRRARRFFASGRGGTAPELDASSFGSAGALLAGGALLVAARRRRRD